MINSSPLPSMTWGTWTQRVLPLPKYAMKWLGGKNVNDIAY